MVPSNIYILYRKVFKHIDSFFVEDKKVVQSSDDGIVTVKMVTTELLPHQLHIKSKKTGTITLPVVLIDFSF